MPEGDPLDDLLSAQPAKVHRRTSRLLEVVREAYPIGVPALIMKSQTDRLGASGRYAFHLGTPDAVLRRICSWLLTHGDADVLAALVPALWGRHGREDVALAALVLANHPTLSDIEAWAVFSDAIGEVETAEALLLTIEEMLRAERVGPELERLIEWSRRGTSHAHAALLTAHAEWMRGGRPALDVATMDFVTGLALPEGDGILQRIRLRMTEG